jgi:hypothetical protein
MSTLLEISIGLYPRMDRFRCDSSAKWAKIEGGVLLKSACSADRPNGTGDPEEIWQNPYIFVYRCM